MNLPDTPENHIPIRSAKVRWRPQTRDRITISICIVNHNICSIIHLDLRSKICMDFNMVIHILSFDSEKQGAEPFKGAEVTADPEEVDFAETSLFLWVVHAVPDGFEDRCEWRDTNTCSNQNGDFVFEDIFRCRAEGPIDVDSREDPTDCWIDTFCPRTILVDTNDLRSIFLSPWLIDFASKHTPNSLGKVSLHSHMDGDIIFLWCRSEGERVVLPDRDLRTAEEDVLTSSRLGVLLFYLNFADHTRVLDDLGDVCLVLPPNLSSNSFHQIDVSTVHPVLPENANSGRSKADTIGSEIGLNHAESSMDGPEHEEHNKHVVGVPEALEVSSPHLFVGS